MKKNNVFCETISQMLGPDVSDDDLLYLVKLGATINQFPVNFYFVDCENKCQLANQRVLDMLGLSREEFVGTRIDAFAEKTNYPKKNLLQYMEEETRVMETGRVFVDYHEPVLMGNGETYCFRTTRAPYYNYKGDIAGAMSVCHYLDNEQDNDVLDPELKINTFASIMHDVKDSLLEMQVLLKQGLERSSPQLDSAEIMGLEAITNRLLSSADQHLSASRNRSILLETDAIEFSVGEAIDQVVGCQQSKFNRKRISFSVEGLQGNPRIVAVKSAFLLVMGHLLSNALKFTPCAGSVMICVASKGNRNEYVFSVKDTGVGVAKKNHNKTFEPYTQIKPDPTHGGYGHGLAEAKLYVEKYLGGKIEVLADYTDGFGIQFSCTEIRE